MEKFPDLADSTVASRNSRGPSPHAYETDIRSSPKVGTSSLASSLEPILETHGGWGVGTTPQVYHSSRTKPHVSEAFQHLQASQGSISKNAHELAEALKVPISPRLVGLCVLWYWSSALTNTSSKMILNAFPKAATLTMVQFACVVLYCVLFSWIASVQPQLRKSIPSLRNGLRKPTSTVIRTALPLALFQIGGHLFSSNATQRIPVSLVHVIKGLSPLFTVFAYRFFYKIRYPTATYVSLIPLTAGVMLACTRRHAQSFQAEFTGIIFALAAAIIFVTQNIFSKKLFNQAAKIEAEGSQDEHSLDKLNLLCYSSGIALVITSPYWFWAEGIWILKNMLGKSSVELATNPHFIGPGRLTLELIFNGICHFGQNIMAFVLLSLVSPVTYSVASLIKRVFVIVMAVIWFRDKPTTPQLCGIVLTFLGLYLYDRSNEHSKADRKAQLAGTLPQPLLPLTSKLSLGTGNRLTSGQTTSISTGPILTLANNQDINLDKKFDGSSRGRLRGNSNASRLPGTRQEETWRISDRIAMTS